MSINDLPGTVTIKRQWPLGLVVSLLTAILWFVFQTQSSVADLEKRTVRLENRDEKRVETDAAVKADVAVIKNTVESIRELLREDRRRKSEP